MFSRKRTSLWAKLKKSGSVGEIYVLQLVNAYVIGLMSFI